MVHKILNDGISISDGNIIMNTEKDSDNDILNIVHTDIYKSEFLGNTYYFGYVFNNDASRKDRTTVIKWLKGINGEGIDNKSLRKLIDKPLFMLDKVEDLSTFDAVICPKSGRSDLTKIIVSEINKFTQHSTEKVTFELIKNLPNNISFDWKSFNINYSGEIGDNQYRQIYDYVEDTLIPKIHNLSYFSIADNVKYKYRQYIKDYLVFPDEDTKNIISAIQHGKILIVDDINTSGSTLTEVLRIIKSINNTCEIYIFTLIGKE